VRHLFGAMALAAVITSTAASASFADTNGHGRPAAPGLGIRLVDAPTSLANDPRAHAYIIDGLAPGAVIDRRVQVVNGTAETARVSMYAAAASISHGSFTGARGHTQNEVSSWTTTRPRSLSLAPQARAFVHVTVHVPSDASPGERYGVVWAEVTTPPLAGSGVTQVSRIGIRLYLSIGPGGPPASDLAITSMTAIRDAHGNPMVRATIHNTGGRALDLSGSLSLSDGPSGLSTGPFPIRLGTTLGIGQTEPVYVTLDRQVPDGPWLATLTARSGLLKRTARATLTFPSGPGAGAAITARPLPNQRPWVLWGVITLSALLLLVALLYVLRRRRGLVGTA